MPSPIRFCMAAFSVTAALAFTGCGGEEGEAGGLPAAYELPGERVFPEGIGIDKASGDFFVTSAEDGTVFRGNVREPELEVFLPGGEDGRTAATGVRMRDGRLWVAGRFTGRLFVYDVASRQLVRRYAVPDVGETFSPRAEPALVNDLTFAGEYAYVTDSFQPVVYRVGARDGEPGELEPWLDLRDTPVAYGRGFNLNGITASDDERYLLAVSTLTGKLFRIDVRTREVREVDLGGADLRTGDGLLLDGTALLVVREEPGEIQPVRLSADLLRGTLGEPFGRSELRYPTTMSELDGRALVVNSQLDRGDDPELPFTVSAVPVPDGVLPRR